MTIYASEAGTLLMQLAIDAARTTILAALAALLLAAFRVKATHLRLFTWTAVLYAGLGMPLLGGMLPSIHIPVPFAAVTAPTRVVTDVSPTTALPVRQITGREIEPAIAPSHSFSNTPPASKPQGSRSARFASLPWTALVLGGYLAIAVYLLIRLVIGVVLARRLVRKSIPIHHPRLTALIRHLNSRPTAEIVESRSVSVPLTVGVIKPAILLPISWREWDDEKFAGVITHEMSHVGRHDCLSQHVSLLHRAVFWFSPLSWWLNRQIIELAEQASDEEALSRGTDQHSYARALLGFLETIQAAPGRVRWQGVSMASSGRAEKRLEKVLAWRGEKQMATNKSTLTAVVVLAIPVLYLAAAGRPVKAAAAQKVMLAQDQAPAAPTEQSAPPPSIDTAPVNAAPPQAPNAGSSDVAPASPANPDSPPAPPQSPNGLAGDIAQHGYWYRAGWNSDDEQRFVIVSGKSVGFTMSGSREDARHVERLKQNIAGDFIWFERDEKSYIIRDQATVDRARALWAPQEELGKKQAALGKQQEALGKQQEELGRRMRDVRVKVPDMTAEVDKLKAELQQLGPDATMEQIGRIQSEIGRLQSHIGRIQADAGDDRGKLGEEMGLLGEKQGDLGRQQGELGRQQGELAEKANREMKQLLDDAIKKGIAQPERGESGGASL